MEAASTQTSDRSTAAAPEAPTTRSEGGGLSINTDRAIRCSCFAGALVLVLLLSLFSRGYETGIAHIATIGLMVYALRGREIWERYAALPHFISLGPLLIGLFGLCQSACGGLTYYDAIAGIPTDLIGVATHLGVGFVVASRMLPPAYGYALMTIAIGGSLTYLGILVGNGSYCAPCTAVHALMIAQGILLIRSHLDWHGFAYAGWILAWSGILNGWFHHRAMPGVQNDPEMLYDYLTTMWIADRPPQQIVSTREAGSPRLVGMPQERETASPPPVAPERAPSTAAPEPRPAPATTQDAAQPAHPPVMGMLGSPDAPVLVRINFDFKCPACGAFFREIMSLLDLVRSKHIRIEFLFTYHDVTAQAASTIAYACSASSEELFLKVSSTMMAKMSILHSPQDCILAVRELIPPEELKNLIRTHQEGIRTMLTKTERIRLLTGSTGTPTVWIHDGRSNDPKRVFSGYVTAAAMRLSIDTLLKSL